MKLIIDKDRKVYSAGTWGTVNENDYEILDFEFPAELEEYNKRIVYYLGDERVWDTIVNNKAYITNAITTKCDVKAYVWCTKENTEREADTDFRTQLFEMQFYENDNADGIVPTPEQVDGFNTMLTAMNNKIDEVDALEQTIETAEAERQEAETTRVSNESTRESNESTRQTNEQTRQSQEADRERRTDEAIADIEDKTAEYNANAEAKTTAFNNNATQKTNEFNSNYTQKVNNFNSNATSKTNDFNSNASGKTTTFNDNATSKTNTFNSNASSKTTDFNTNAENKTSAFNTNASDKTTVFDNNASSKTTTFNENATSKTNDFNDNASAKTTAFNNNALEKTEDFDEHTEEMQQEIDELSANMPWDTTEQATEIQVTDAAKYSRNKLELFGNTSQDSTSIDGGDEYDSPSPDHPQPIHVVTGSNIVAIHKKNIIPTQESAWEQGAISNENGELSDSTIRLRTKNFMPITEDTYRASIQDNTYAWVNVIYYDKNCNYITSQYQISNMNGTTEKTIKIPKNTAFYKAVIRNSNSSTTITPSEIQSIKPQIELGASTTEWEAYSGNIYPINLGSLELCKIGNYQDTIFKNTTDSEYYDSSLVENGWYKYGAIGKATLRGGFLSGGVTNVSYYNKITNYAINNNIPFSTHFRGQNNVSGASSANTLPDNSIAFINVSGSTTPRLYIRSTSLSTATLLNNYLVENPTDIYYALQTSTTTQITDETLISQLDAIYEHLQLVKGTNNITVTAADLKPYMKLTYKKPIQPELNDLQTQIDDLANDVDDLANDVDDEVENLQNQINDLNQEVQELSENMPWNTTEQATEITVDDAAKYSKNKMKIFGNTEQTQYSGSNKLDISTNNTEYTNNGVTITFNDTNQKIIINGTSSVSGGTTIMNQPINLKTSLTLQAGTYYFIPQILGGTFTSAENSRINGISLRDTNGNSIVSINSPVNSTDISTATFTLTEEKTISAIRFYMTGALKFNNWELALSVSDTNAYEPFVGGVPSPNPDYPQDIHVVTGNNSVGVTGKNLCSTIMNVTLTAGSEKWSTKSLTTADSNINWEIGTTYYIMAFLEKQSNEQVQISNYNYLRIDDAVKSFTFNGTIPRIRVGANTLNNNISNEEVKIMVSKTNFTDYAPYYHADYPINLGSLELCGNGNHKDEIFKNEPNNPYYDNTLVENGWYKKKRINKYYFSMSKLFQISGSNFYLNITGGAIHSKGYMPSYKYDSRASGFNNMKDYYFGFETSGTLHVKNSNYTDRISFTQSLVDANEYIYYVLKDTENIQITDETLIAQLEAIYNHLALVKGINHITITPSDLAPYVTLNYMQDLPSKLDNLDSRLSLLE